MIELIKYYGLVDLILFSLFSLCVGSFIGLFVCRFPKILEQYEESDQHLLPMLLARPQSGESLAYPRSYCVHCTTPISISQNIPILSFVLLKGKCSSCKNSISPLYPIIEIVTALGGLGILMKFGISYETIPFYLLICSLVALSFIDIKHRILPDQITLPLLWLGLFTNLVFDFTPLVDAVLGSILGYLILWGIFWAYKFLTGKEALGFGDFKLLATVGAWFGIHALNWIVLMAALTGLIFALSQVLFTSRSLKDPVAFGPFLSLASVIYLFFQKEILQSINFYL